MAERAKSDSRQDDFARAAREAAARDVSFACPECGRVYPGTVPCTGSFSKHARHPAAVCVPQATEGMIMAGAAALKLYLDKATFSEVVGDDHDIASAVLRAAFAAWGES